MPVPSVSVIIPVYNDPEGVRLTLESVTNQTYPTDDYETVVVNNNSNDGTQEVINRYHDRYPERVRPVFEPEQAIPYARNAGIDAARGDILAFIDADMTVKADWLESAIESFQSGDHDYMGCAVELYPPDGRATLGTKYDSVFRFNMQTLIEDSHYAGGGCLFVRKNVFDTIGVFDNQLSELEDREFGQRVHEAGFDLHYEPSVTMYHPARSSLAEQLKKNFRNGRGVRQLHNIHPDRFDADHPFYWRRFLPLHPQRFHAAIGDSENFTERELMELYLFSWANKVAGSIGSLYEHFKNHPKPTATGR